MGSYYDPSYKFSFFSYSRVIAVIPALHSQNLPTTAKFSGSISLGLQSNETWHQTTTPRNNRTQAQIYKTEREAFAVAFLNSHFYLSGRRKDNFPVQMECLYRMILMMNFPVRWCISLDDIKTCARNEQSKTAINNTCSKENFKFEFNYLEYLLRQFLVFNLTDLRFFNYVQPI